MSWDPVYRLVKQIPRGRVITYGALAKAVTVPRVIMHTGAQVQLLANGGGEQERPERCPVGRGRGAALAPPGPGPRPDPSRNGLLLNCARRTAQADGGPTRSLDPLADFTSSHSPAPVSVADELACSGHRRRPPAA